MMNLRRQTFVRFLIVGIINTLVGTTVMFSLYNLASCSYWVSSAANYIFTSILSFFLNKNYTFQYKGDVKGSVLRFIINIVACYLLAYGIAKPLVFYFAAGSDAFRENLAMLVGMCFFVGFNYLGQRLFAFKE